ncbi:MAG: carboxypeptidase regulatory-like domain-containing protein [Pyrinomonadaceae bacterium]
MLLRATALGSLLLLLLLCSEPRAARARQQAAGSLSVRVADALGGLVVGANVRVRGADGSERVAAPVSEGVYVAPNLTPGAYTVLIVAKGFAAYEKASVEVTGGRRTSLDVTLEVTIADESVTVSKESSVNTDPENNADAIVIHGSDLDALPDDPDDLAAALRGLAGPSSGPGGGQFLVDGFSSGRIPPKESIREIRINQNPFSAEYDRLGYGRVEILTKPGTDRYRGLAFINFNDESLNSRNPFSLTRPPYQMRLYGGNLSGPLKGRSSSFFLDFERREIQDNAVVNALVLDPAFNIIPFRQAVLVPQRRLAFSPRFDFQLTPEHSLMARYAFVRSTQAGAGVGDFSLPSRAYDVESDEHMIQLSETAVLSQRVINETRFQYVHRRRTVRGDNSLPTISVLDAVVEGGSTDGLSFQDEDRWELHNLSTWSAGRHTLKAGGRLRGVRLLDSSTSNFGGTFTFAGGAAPRLDENDQPVLDAQGRLVFEPVTSIERYRRTRLFLAEGLSPAEVRRRGGGATQLSLAAGEPEARASRIDLGAFFLDDWRLRPNLTLSFGLRYEAQSNIGSDFNFAPRVAFAWMPGAGRTRRPKTVVRGGFGVFYERFGESLTLQANRFDGVGQRQFVTADPDVLDLFPAPPSADRLADFAVPHAVWRVAEDVQSPYTLQFAISVERQLPSHFTVTTTFINARVLHFMRARNVNAPLPGTYSPEEPGGGLRPVAGAGNIFRFESSGRFDQRQLVVGVTNLLNRNVSMFATYVLSKAQSDTDGAFSFPVNQYDLAGEYGRSALDVRHSLTLGGSVNAPWRLKLNPFVLFRSGAPFNITTGRDTNGDTIFNERPALAADLDKPGVVVTRFGAFDPNPEPGQQLIPRNFGQGPSFFTINLRIGRTFGLVDKVSASKSSAQTGRSGQGARSRQSVFAGIPGVNTNEKRFSLTFSIQVLNILNHTNQGPTIGNLSSPLFGRSTVSAGSFGSAVASNSAGNRRIEAQLRFSF